MIKIGDESVESETQANSEYVLLPCRCRTWRKTSAEDAEGADKIVERERAGGLGADVMLKEGEPTREILQIVKKY